MAELENKRIRRTPQERAAELESKIEKAKESIADLEEKKQAAISDYDAKIAAVQDRIKALETKSRRFWPLSRLASLVRRKSRRFRRLSNWQ